MKSFSTFLLEKKDHIIKRLKNLSPEEKDQVISFFAKKPNLENQINWQDRNLTFKDFQKVMDTTKTERRKAVKKMGLAGLKEGKDYIELHVPEGNEYRAFIPLHWEASKLLASTKIGGVEGKWCTAYQKDPSYFMNYVKRDRNYLVYFIKEGDKNALRLSSTFGIEEFRDKDNYSIREFSDSAINVKGPEFDEFISSNKISFNVARKKLDALKSVSWLDMDISLGSVIVQNASFEISETDALIWHNGVWKDGTWKSGRWEGGTWKRGRWHDGTWKTGSWDDGTWKTGVWEDGTWNDGDWWSGTWEDGTWKTGSWDDGTWKGGTWKSGIWWNGIWKNGTWNGGNWWNGTWEDGTWEDGTWKNGWYEGGVWKDGTWKGGIWEDGTWKNGIWEDGTWKNGWYEGGVWKDGTWKGGIWEDGLWKGGNWEYGLWKGGMWNGGIWLDGIWYGGIWEGGTWAKGTWEGGDWWNGTWLDGTWKGGYDKDGKYHPAGDSPDKWNK